MQVLLITTTVALLLPLSLISGTSGSPTTPPGESHDHRVRHHHKLSRHHHGPGSVDVSKGMVNVSQDVTSGENYDVYKDEGVGKTKPDAMEDGVPQDTHQTYHNHYHGPSTTAEEFPFIAALYKYGEYTCAGSLLQHGRVLTAQHCVEDIYLLSSLTVYLGSTREDHKDPGELRLAVTAIIPYSHISVYNLEDGHYDIAILQLETVPEITSTIQPIDILNDTSPLGFVKSLGWGHKLYTEIPHILQIKYLHIKARSRQCPCHDKTYEICAESKYRNLCYGDSGGPLVKRVDGTYHLIGVTVRTTPACPEENKRAIFTRASYFRDWIENPTYPTDAHVYVPRNCSTYRR